MNDIDASETKKWNDGKGFRPVEIAGGTFDGNGHVIKNLFINRPSARYVGLFGRVRYKWPLVYKGAVVKNVGLENVSVSSDTRYARVGGLAGYVFGSGAGGRSIIRNCYSTGRVNGVYYVGVGWSHVSW